MNKTVLFLYSEVMPYTLACFRAMRLQYGNEIYVIRWDKNILTPFIPQAQDGIHLFNRSEHDLTSIRQLVDQIKPAVIYIVGRMDPDYLKVARYARKKKIPTISGWDNPWYGTLRNYLACLGATWLYRRYFDFIMVAGIWQYEYVRRIGYPRHRILFHQYSCDIDLFTKAFKTRETNDFPEGKKILFTGRLAEVKGIVMLTSIFKELYEDSYSDWKLVVIGNGPLQNELVQHPGIEYVPFSNQEQIAEHLTDASFFCLPSITEPWGVVIHEMAAAGLPLLTSDACGASTAFLVENYNGLVFRTRDAEDLKKKLVRMMQLSPEERRQMSLRSHQLAQQITPLIWSNSIMSVLDSQW